MPRLKRNSTEAAVKVNKHRVDLMEFRFHFEELLSEKRGRG